MVYLNIFQTCLHRQGVRESTLSQYLLLLKFCQFTICKYSLTMITKKSLAKHPALGRSQQDAGVVVGMVPLGSAAAHAHDGSPE